MSSVYLEVEKDSEHLFEINQSEEGIRADRCDKKVEVLQERDLCWVCPPELEDDFI